MVGKTRLLGGVRLRKGAFSALASLALVLSLGGAGSTLNAENAWAEGAELAISTAEQWNAFATEVNGGNSYEGKKVKLESDLDFTAPGAPEFTVVGESSRTEFAGTFDGGYHTIKVDLDCADEERDFVAVFGNVGGAAVVSNFKVAGEVSSAGRCVAGAVAYADGTAQIRNVGNDAAVTGTHGEGYTAGVLAYTQAGDGVLVSGCYNKGRISSGYFAGGILACSGEEKGQAEAPTIVSCYNVGAVTSTDSYRGCSGIVGKSGVGNPNTAISHYTKIYNSLDAGDYKTNFQQNYFCSFSPYSSVTSEQANYYKTPIDGGYICQSSFGAPENYFGVTAGQLSGSEDYKGKALVESMNTAVTKAAGVEWLAAKRLGQPAPGFDWEVERQAGEPVITAEPRCAENAHGVTGAKGVVLSLAARTPAEGEAGHDGTLSYEWHEASDPANPNPESDPLLGVVASGEFTTPIDASAGEHAYYCIVVNTFGEGRAASTTSGVATVTYLSAEVASPLITVQPQSIAGKKTQLDEVTFTVEADSPDNGMLSYQWYVQELDESGEDPVWNPVDSTANPTAATAEFKPVNFGLGAQAFKCSIVNEREGFKSAALDTDVASVTYQAFPVANADDLKRLRDAVNAGRFERGAAKLVGGSSRVIDLAGEESWEPIGTVEHPFAGSLTADDHVTISNMKIADKGDGAKGNAALIGFAKGATLENFTVTGEVASDKQSLAGVLARNLSGAKTRVSRVGNEASVATSARAASSSGVGGIVGTNEGTLSIERCCNKGALSSSVRAYNFGGLVGYSGDSLSLLDSYNVGSITLGGTDYQDCDSYLGGLVGNSYRSLEVKRCYNTGVLKFFYYSSTSRYGGIAGSAPNGSDFENNYYLGTTDAFTWNCQSSGKPSPKGVGYASGLNEQPSPMTAPSNARNLGQAFSTTNAPRVNKGYPRLAWEPEYEAPSYAVKFSVAGTDGQAVADPDVVVKFGDKAVRAEADGSFLLKEDVAYAYAVSAGEGYGTFEGTVTPTPEAAVAGSIEVPVTLTRLHAVTFAAKDKADGSAIDDATVAVTKRGGSAVEASNGVYRLEHGATYDYAVSKRGFNDESGSFVAEKDDAIAVELEKGKYTVTFAAVDANSAPVEGFTVALALDGNAVDAEAPGVYKLDGGVTYSYAVTAKGYAKAEGEITPDKTDTVTVTLVREGCVLTVVNQYGTAKEYAQEDLVALATDAKKGNSTTLRTQSASKSGYGVKAAKPSGYVTLANLLADADATWKHGYKLHVWTGDEEYALLADTTFEAIDAMKWFYPNATQLDPDETSGASDANPFSIAWEIYEAGCSGETTAASAVEQALKGTPVTGSPRVLAGAWLADGKVQAPGSRMAKGVTKIVVERYDSEMLEVVNHEGKSTRFSLSDLKNLAQKNTGIVKMQYAGKNGGTVKAALKDDYATLDSIFDAADVTWGEGYELEIYDSNGTIYAPGEKWTDTSYAAVSEMKWFYPNATTDSAYVTGAEKVPMSLAWTTHTNAWGDQVTAAASLAAALNAPAKDEFRLIVGGWVDPVDGMMVPGWRSATDITKIRVLKTDFTKVDKKALNQAISDATADKDATAQSETGDDVANGKAYASAKAHEDLATAIDAAQKVADSEMVTQKQVNAAASELKKAVEAFDGAKSTAEVDLSELEGRIASATEMAGKATVAESADDVAYGETWVSAESLAAFKEAIASAKAVAESATVTKLEAAAAERALATAMETFASGGKTGTKPTPVSSLKFKAGDQSWTGKAIEPLAKSVVYGGKTLVMGIDYEVEYANNLNVGTATATVTAKSGLLIGSTVVRFKINPPSTKIGSLKAGKGKLTAKWSKRAKQVDGYELCYSANASFSKSKVMKVKGAKKKSAVVKKLKAGKKYRVKVRAYKKVGAETYYSAWSLVKVSPAIKGAKKKSAASASKSGLMVASVGF